MVRASWPGRPRPATRFEVSQKSGAASRKGLCTALVTAFEGGVPDPGETTTLSRRRDKTHDITRHARKLAPRLVPAAASICSATCAGA